MLKDGTEDEGATSQLYYRSLDEAPLGAMFAKKSPMSSRAAFGGGGGGGMAFGGIAQNAPMPVSQAAGEFP